jgi:hypothetical protein
VGDQAFAYLISWKIGSFKQYNINTDLSQVCCCTAARRPAANDQYIT